MEKSSERYYILGIDAGGTFTDLALLTAGDMKIFTYTKVETNHENILDTIENGFNVILKNVKPQQIKSVSLATTFATNSLVEKKFCKALLILLGYDKESVYDALSHGLFHSDNVIFANGAHDPLGKEVEPLDIGNVIEQLPNVMADVRSVAVSGYFATRNPEHELAVKRVINEKFPQVYVTCGHEITSSLNAVIRAATTFLNAALIPVVSDLFDTVKRMLERYGVSAPVSLVKNDGSLVGLEWGKLYPVDTVFSGPVASSAGAFHLTVDKNFAHGAWVVDIGGTTTDIIHLDANGSPDFSPDGATIGGFKMFLETADIYTFGLGGDSRISRSAKKGSIDVGPRRVTPLCSAAAKDKSIVGKLLDEKFKKNSAEGPLLVCKNRTSSSCNGDRDNIENLILTELDSGSLSVPAIMENVSIPGACVTRILNDMENSGVVRFCGFTPTDALNVLGAVGKWNIEASRLGACILAGAGGSVNDFCQKVYRRIITLVAINLLRKSFARSGIFIKRDGEAEHIIMDNLCGNSGGGPCVSVRLDGGVIGVGAPSWAFIKDVADVLGTDFVVPGGAEVAGAVGAAVGRFEMHRTVVIRRGGKGFNVYLPDMTVEYNTLEEAVEKGKSHMVEWVRRSAALAGAAEPDITVERRDESVSDGKNNSGVYLWTELAFAVHSKMAAQ